MKVYTITNQKGGSGKTTTADILADLFALSGKKVLRIDLDAQGNLSDIMRARTQDKPTAYEVIKGTGTALEAIQTTPRGDIIPGSYNLAALDDEAPNSLKNALESIAGKYDIVVIDTPPALSIVTINALMASDSVIVTSSLDAFSLKGLKRISELIADLKKNNPDLKLEGVLLTRYNKRGTVDQDMEEVAEQLASMIGTKVFKARIRSAAAVTKAQLKGESLFLAATGSTAAEDYKAFYNELVE